MRLTLTLLILLIGQSITGQSISKKIQKIVDEIAAANVYESSAIHFSDTKTTQWNRFEKLKNKATDQELIALTDHEHPVVRGYSFQALASRSHPETFAVLQKHLKDYESLSISYGYNTQNQTVGLFCISLLYSNRIPTFKLTDQQKFMVDSVLLFDSKIKRSENPYLLTHITPNNAFYSRIKEIYKEERSSSALIAISKYKKPADTALIADWLTRKSTDDQLSGLNAVRNFPHPAFLPYLQKIQEQEIKKTSGFNFSLISKLYLATVQFKNRESRALIENTLSEAEKPALDYHAASIRSALTLYPDPVYAGIKETIETSNMNKGVLKK